MKFLVVVGALALSACATTPKVPLSDGDADRVIAAFKVAKENGARAFCALTPQVRDEMLARVRALKYLSDRGYISCPAPGLVQAEPRIVEP